MSRNPCPGTRRAKPNVIDLVGITLDIYGPGGIQGPQILVNYGKTLGVGNFNSGTD